jgi:lipoate-protein ligase A
MADLKHVMTFEQYSSQETEKIDENLIDSIKKTFSSLKTNIDTFLKNPVDMKEADSLLTTAFAGTFNAKATAHLKADLLAEDLKTKINILTQCSQKLSDSKIGVLKIFQTDKGWEVGGNALVAHTGGGMKA